MNKKFTLIVSANTGSEYLKYTVIQKKVCTILNLDLLVCETGSNEFSLSENHIKIPCIPEISDVFMAQVIRFMAPCFFPEKHFILGDIDMLFLSKSYLDQLLEKVENFDGISLIDSDTYKNVLRYPMCYYIAQGKVFKDILNLGSEISLPAIIQFSQNLKDRNEGWTTDEYFLAEQLHLAGSRIQVQHINQRNLFFGMRRSNLSHRINRKNFKYSILKLGLGLYVDAHCPVPLDKNMKIMQPILDYVDCEMNGTRFLKLQLAKQFKPVKR